MTVTRSYYEVIGDLAAFELSQSVSFTKEQLIELIQQEQAFRLDRDDLNQCDFSNKKKIPIHSYLGTLSSKDAEEASKHLDAYNLKHTLLGGYVPREQLESLSGSDFAYYLHKVLECSGSIDTYGKYVNPGKIHISNDSSASSPVDQISRLNMTGSFREPHTKKVVLCKLCKARFSGPRRFTELSHHRCMK